MRFNFSRSPSSKVPFFSISISNLYGGFLSFLSSPTYGVSRILVHALTVDDVQCDAMLYTQCDQIQCFHDGLFLLRVHFTIINMKYL